MTKEQLTEAMARETGSSKNEAARMLNALSAIVMSELSRGREFTLPGIGRLNTAHRAARQQRNPQTGEMMTVPERIAVTFKAVKSLRDAVQQQPTIQE